MAEKKKNIKVSVPKPAKTRIGTTSTPPLASQGNQGATFDKIMREKYDWWK